MTLEEYARQNATGEPQRAPESDASPQPTNYPPKAQNATGEAQRATESHDRPKQENCTAKPQNATESKFDPLESKWLLETAYKICARYKVNRQATDGIFQQVLQEISRKQDPIRLILFLSEALDRASGGGDTYIKQVEAALIENGYQSDALTL